jgi:hypothetical protein
MPFKKGDPNIHRGRALGAKNKRPEFLDYITESEASELVIKAKELADKGDKDMLKFLLEHYFGKAPQRVDGDFNLTGSISLVELFDKAQEE